MRTKPIGRWYEEQRWLYAGIPVGVAFAPADEHLAVELWAYLEQINDIFNDHRDDSEVGRINSGSAGTFVISAQLAAAFALAERIESLSGRAFAITTGPLRRLWREAAQVGQRPDPAAIAAAVVPPGAWRREGTLLTVADPRIRFDFGGLIKGAAVDYVMTRLMETGAAAALVQCGGETACRGLSQRGQPHILGIPDPECPDGRLWCTLRDLGSGLSASTSGNYRNDLVIAGTPCHHIFDPRSGEPVAAGVLSVSVVFPRWGCNGLADGLATAGTVLGWREFLPLVTQEGGEALVLTREDGLVVEHATAGWRGLASG